MAILLLVRQKRQKERGKNIRMQHKYYLF